MSFLISLLVSFAIGFTGHATPAEQPVTAPVAVQQVVEADPVLKMDAAATLDDTGAQKTFNDERGNHFELSYIDSDESSDSMYGEYTAESIDLPGVFHHYKYLQVFNS